METNGIPLDPKARRTDHRGEGRVAGSIMHSEMRDARHVTTPTNHRGEGRMVCLTMDLARTDLAEIATSDHPTNGLTLDLGVHRVGVVVGFGESRVGVTNPRREADDGLL